MLLDATADNMQRPLDEIIMVNLPKQGALQVYAVYPPLVHQISMLSVIQRDASRSTGAFGYSGLAYTAGAWSELPSVFTPR